MGALKLGVYEGYELLLGGWLARWGCSKFLKSMCCGAAAGVTTGLLTTPIDVVMTRPGCVPRSQGIPEARPPV